MRFCRNLAFLLLFTSILGCGHAQQAPQPIVIDLSRYEHFVIIGTNDIHGYLRPLVRKVGDEDLISGGIDWFAGYVDILRQKYGDHLILLDGGDLFQGTLDSNLSHGEPVIAAYNQMHYMASAVGNHEFDYGPLNKGDEDRLGYLKKNMASANFPFVAANIYYKGTQRHWQEKNLFSSILQDIDGVKVGVIGLTTATTPKKTLPLNVESLDFGDITSAAAREANSLRAQGADIVLIATHEGNKEAGTPVVEMLQALPPGTIDAVVSGHYHKEVHEFINGVPVIQSKTQGKFFGRIDLYFDRTTFRVQSALTQIQDMHAICGNWLADKDSCDATQADGKKSLPLRPAVYEGFAVTPDLEVRKIVEPYLKKADKMRNEVLGQASRDFVEQAEGQTEVGSLYTAAIHAKFPKVKVVYLNGGGFRRLLLKGPVTYGDLYETNPFDNHLMEVKMSGAELKELVRVGVSGSQKIPFVSHVKIVYHRGESPSYERDVNGDGKKEPWERDRLVSLTWENGQPVKDNETFWVGTIDYLVGGGDNCGPVFDKIPEKDKKITEFSPLDTVAEYLRAHPGLQLPIEEPVRVKSIP